MSAISDRYRQAVKSVRGNLQNFGQRRSALSCQTVSGISHLLYKNTVPSGNPLNSGHGLRDNHLEKSNKVTDLNGGQILGGYVQGYPAGSDTPASPDRRTSFLPPGPE